LQADLQAFVRDTAEAERVPKAHPPKRFHYLTYSRRSNVLACAWWSVLSMTQSLMAVCLWYRSRAFNQAPDIRAFYGTARACRDLDQDLHKGLGGRRDAAFSV